MTTATSFSRFSLRAAASLLCFGVALVSALLGGDAFAQGRGSVVSWSAAPTRPAARAGEKIAVRVTATVQPGYHIYSIIPVENGPQATEITVAAKGLLPVGKVIEPKPEVVNDPNFGLKIGMHEGTASFTRVLMVPPKARPGSVPLTVSVRYMACNDRSCLPPKTVTVAAPALTIEAGPKRKEFADAFAVPGATDGSGGSDGGTLASTAAPKAATPVADSGLGTFLLTAFGAGLIALVTPCVFPLIPVTLAFFTKLATEKSDTAPTQSDAVKPVSETHGTATVQSRVIKLAGLYCIGIIVAFTAIGAVLAATVGAAGANRLAANQWVNLGFGALFIVFALSLLEVIELRPPAFLQRLSSGRPNKNAGALGVLGMGLTFVIAAFTCTAPFIGTVLVAAASAQSSAQWIRPILGMATFATALALPFFLLALFPALLTRLPKSGAWLSTVKGAMGWVELAAAVKFLSNADQVFGWNLLNRPTILALWALVFMGAGFWLLGLLRIGWGAPDAPATPARRAFAGVFLALGVYCVYGLTGRPLDSFTVAYLPPTSYGVGAAETAKDELAFLPTLEEGIARAKAENKPIFVDFTGYTCTNCRWMESNIFPKPPVKEEMANFVRVRLYTDDRVKGEALQKYQEKTFGTIALPLYAILDSSGKPVTTPVGKTDTADEFAKFLRQGREVVSAGADTTTVAQNR